MQCSKGFMVALIAAVERAGIAVGLAELPSSRAPGSECAGAIGRTKEYCTFTVIY